MCEPTLLKRNSFKSPFFFIFFTDFLFFLHMFMKFQDLWWPPIYRRPSKHKQAFRNNYLSQFSKWAFSPI